MRLDPSQNLWANKIARLQKQIQPELLRRVNLDFYRFLESTECLCLGKQTRRKSLGHRLLSPTGKCFPISFQFNLKKPRIQFFSFLNRQCYFAQTKNLIVSSIEKADVIPSDDKQVLGFETPTRCEMFLNKYRGTFNVNRVPCFPANNSEYINTYKINKDSFTCWLTYTRRLLLHGYRRQSITGRWQDSPVETEYWRNLLFPSRKRPVHFRWPLSESYYTQLIMNFKRRFNLVRSSKMCRTTLRMEQKSKNIWSSRI